MILKNPESWKDLPATQAEAKAVGSRYFITEKPCRNLHRSPRRTSTRHCLMCLRENILRWRASHSATYKEYQRSYQKRWYDKMRTLAREAKEREFGMQSVPE